MRVTGTTNFCPCCSGTKPGHLGYEADPTVTAVSEERLRELRANLPEVLIRVVPSAAKDIERVFDELLRARSALADVGESGGVIEVVYTWPDGREEVRYRTTAGTARAAAHIAEVRELRAKHGDQCPYTWRVMASTGKQPRPADSEGLTAADYEEVLADHRRLVRELDIALNGDGAAKQASLVDIVAQVTDKRLRLSPAAHTAQVTEDVEDLVRVYGNVTYCEAKGLTHDSGKTAAEVETQLILALRRLAEQGSGAK